MCIRDRSFNLDAVIIPEEKEKLVQEGYERSDSIMEDYNMGLITNNERYNQGSTGPRRKS